MSARDPVRVVVVGQVPPPHHGQAAMIQALIDGTYTRVEIRHVPLAFSKTIDDIGKIRLRKLVELMRVIWSILWVRFTFGGDVLYYPPAGPNRVPVIRDVAILLSVRWLFRGTVFHFHAGGVSELLPQLSRPLRWLAARAYGKADLAILCAAGNPPDGSRLGAREEVVLHHGIEDMTVNHPRRASLPVSAPAERPQGRRAPVILYVGALVEAKGILVLLDACRLLLERRITFSCRIVGSFASSEFEHTCLEFVAEHDLSPRVRFPGVLTGAEKWKAYREADIFCFPTYYESESFGIVLLEAMQFGLPVVATDWRGISEVVESGVTGTLVPPRDAEALSAALESLLTDPVLRSAMGERGRSRFEERFSLESWRDQMERLLVDVGG